jgi:undecaprenyl-diphosphatase
MPGCAIGLGDAVLLGVVQGVTEFLPISSTAHLRIVPALTGTCDPGAAYSAVIQLGTLLAVLLYFARDAWRILVAVARACARPALFRDGDARLGLAIAAGTVPIGVCGILFKRAIEGEARSLYVIAASLIALAALLLLAERLARHERRIADLGFWHAQLIGVAQALALIPGVSRSGVTLTAALFLAMRRDEAARFSFLLSIPAVLAAGVYEMKDVLAAARDTGLAPVVVGTLVSLLAGIAAIHYLLRYLRTRTTLVFVAYRVALGVLLLSLLAAGTLSPLG